MKKHLLALAGLVAVAGAPFPAFAADSMMAGHAMAGPAMATMVCREAKTAEKPNAMMAKTGLICKAIPATAMAHGEVGPDLSKALTSQQIEAAWKAYLEKQFSVPAPTGG